MFTAIGVCHIGYVDCWRGQDGTQCQNTSKSYTFFVISHIRTVQQHLDIIKVLFIHQLMHQ